ncbi:hypothetical protein [Streptomyces anandii]|uniref:hypothetical protein n=1 Tax=Streptomyces anandii TaxID=285454 RepID=UPI00167B207D|nr:hypothetical protein [Streptomyces anandii]GGX96878.1 hypothetical protein GCM10010510_47910 [Streptomyces anandii JCM 4720]
MSAEPRVEPTRPKKLSAVITVPTVRAGLRNSRIGDHQQRARRHRQQARDVELLAPRGLVAALRQHQPTEDERGRADRGVDAEGRLPVDVLDEQSAKTGRSKEVSASRPGPV